MIKIKKLSKSYPKVKIFGDLNLEVSSWEIVSILWPSGSGKSTLLNLISWLDRDFSWKVEILWKNISQIKLDEKMTSFRGRNISFIFQNFNLIDNLTVEENIDLVLDINKIKRNYKTKEILKLVWLEDKNKQYPFNLSWWEKQRVAIARAFIWNSKLLLADEPTGSLDEKNTKNIALLIKRLNKKTKNTIILITHDLEVAKIWDKIFELKNYKLIKKDV